MTKKNILFLFFLMSGQNLIINAFTFKEGCKNFLPYVGCIVSPLIFDLACKCKKNHQDHKSLFQGSTAQIASGLMTGLSYASMYYLYKSDYINTVGKKRCLLISIFFAPIVINALVKIGANCLDQGTGKKDLFTDVHDHGKRGAITGFFAGSIVIASGYR